MSRFDALDRLQSLLGDGSYGLDTPAPPRSSWLYWAEGDAPEPVAPKRSLFRHLLDLAALALGWVAIAAVAYAGLVL